MRIVRSLPYRVRDIENVWIPMRDGARLAARIWLPDVPRPVPAILEYIPYRKREGTRERDEPMHRYFAGHGFAAIRVDVRGSGDSDGLLRDEYTPEELEDGAAVIAWIARQPWCNGAVGMMGKSWGGLNTLQVAALAPRPLKAIVSVCATDDRYRDDAHYMGGCLLLENLVWGSVLMATAAKPPDPEIVGEGWKEAWKRRLEALPLYPAIWLRHPLRDGYWIRGSVAEHYERIRCPSYLVGGWADAYTNAIGRLLGGLSVPRKALVGPWAHVYPHEGGPGPPIGFLQDTVRWWRRWLEEDGAGRDDGIEEPLVRAWMQEPGRDGTIGGRWVAETSWPSPRIRPRRYYLTARGLRARPAAPARLRLRSPETVGLAAGSWCPFGTSEAELPAEQSDEDAGSLVFDAPACRARLEIWGSPLVRLELTTDRPCGLLAVRLNDVAPDGSSRRVTYGLLNLTHRRGHDRLAPPVPHRPFRVAIPLKDVAYAFRPGHRIRLAISTAYWPIVWPSPEPCRVTVRTEASRLELPVRPRRAEDDELAPFEQVEIAPPAEATDLTPGRVARTVARDPDTGEVVCTLSTDLDEAGRPSLTRMDPIGLVHGHGILERYRIREDDPLSARAAIDHRIVLRRTRQGRGADWSVGIDLGLRFSSTPRSFVLDAVLDARLGEAPFVLRRWRRRLPRAGV